MPINTFTNHRGRYLLLLATLFAIWLAATPYNGIIHDARLYTAQALLRLSPSIFSHDPFFQFQSQDNFTIFSSIHAKFIEWLGIFAAAKSLTFIGKALWFAGFLCLSYAVLPHPAALLSLALVITLPSYYDGYAIFTYGESFVSARLFGEALSMGALGAWYVNKNRIAIGLIGLALALHPIMALPALLCIVYDILRRRGITMIRFLGVITILITLILYVRPSLFSALTQTIDAEWLSLLEKRSPFLFVENWQGEWLGKLILLAGIAWTSRRILTKRLRTLAEWELFFPALLISGALIGSSLLHNVLLTQIQLWRVFWLAQIISILLIVRLALRAINPATPANIRYLCAITVCAGLIQGTGGALILACSALGYKIYHKLEG